MNASVYVFGQFAEGYAQYPDDYTASIFKAFYARTREATQIGVHRDGNIMYYSYIRRLENGRYLGMCVVLNGEYLCHIAPLFALFEDLIAELVSMAQMLQFDGQGKIITPLPHLNDSADDIQFIRETLQAAFARQDSAPLPPTDYSKAKDSTKTFTLADKHDEIVKACTQYAYTYIYKAEDYNTPKLGSYLQSLAHLNDERQALEEQVNNLKREIRLLRIKHRNLVWVAILGIVIAALGTILYNKVLFPSEVTHYETGEFVYYGPMTNRMPHGIGVAFYPDNDPQGRRFYIGHFVNGERQDTAAMLFYRDGSYFRGSMTNNEWEQGLFFDMEKSHFVGTFRKNIPWDGTWFRHEKVQSLKQGKVVQPEPPKKSSKAKENKKKKKNKKDKQKR